MIWFPLLVLASALFTRAYRNTFDLKITRVPIRLTQSERIGIDGRMPLHILHLSDLHMENISVEADRIVEDLRNQPLDLIAITGDLLDRARNIPIAIFYIEKLMKLKPTLGTYVVFGNHDYVLRPSKIAQLKSELERIGCRVLINQTDTVDFHGEKLHLIGIDDYATRRSNLAKAYQTVTTDGIRLVLTHDPNIVLKMKEYDYDYLLCGHFHGGQIHWPKPYHLIKMGKLARMNIIQGLHNHEGRPFYISEGLGQTGLNIRLRSRPEITVHTLFPPHYPTHPDARPEHAAVQEGAPTLAIE